MTQTAATEEPSATTFTVHDGDPRHSTDDSLTQTAATEEPSATTFTVHDGDLLHFADDLLTQLAAFEVDDYTLVSVPKRMLEQLLESGIRISSPMNNSFLLI